MKTKLIIAFALFLVVSTVTASAQKNRNFRDENQRIQQGVKSGQITPREAARLNSEKAAIRNEAFNYRANDGRIGPRERADLRRDNRRLSKDICRQKHDRQRRI